MYASTYARTCNHLTLGLAKLTMLTNPLVPYDSCVGVPISCLFTVGSSIVSLSLYSVLNVKALVGSFNQEKALAGAFSMIVKTDGLFAALILLLSSITACYSVRRLQCKVVTSLLSSDTDKWGHFIVSSINANIIFTTIHYPPSAMLPHATLHCSTIYIEKLYK